MIYGRKIGFCGGSGGGSSSKPPEENEWTYLAHKTDGGTWDWTWTAPRNGWYSIHLAGDGGNGGDGGECSSYDRHYDGGVMTAFLYTGGGGGGGGHGGYAVHRAFLKKGAVLTVSRTADGLTAVLGADTIQVTHGKNGKEGQSGTNSVNITGSGNGTGAGGAGGTASGANTLNLSGGAGEGGSPKETKSFTLEYLENMYEITKDVWGTEGGTGGAIAAQKYSFSGANNTDGPAFNLGNGGSGGRGGGGNFNKSGEITRYFYGGTGGAGGRGGVVIDYVA